MRDDAESGIKWELSLTSRVWYTLDAGASVEKVTNTTDGEHKDYGKA